MEAFAAGAGAGLLGTICVAGMLLVLVGTAVLIVKLVRWAFP